MFLDIPPSNQDTCKPQKIGGWDPTYPLLHKCEVCPLSRYPGNCGRKGNEPCIQCVVLYSICNSLFVASSAAYALLTQQAGDGLHRGFVADLTGRLVGLEGGGRRGVSKMSPSVPAVRICDCSLFAKPPAEKRTGEKMAHHSGYYFANLC